MPPARPGEIRAALLGRALTAAGRQGKSLWCATGGDGPVLGLHLGMSGRILVTDATGALTEGGDRLADAGTAAEQADRNPVARCIGAPHGGRTTWFCAREQV